METSKIVSPAQFKRLSRKRKAILVAHDVIEQLRRGTYISNPGFYVEIVRKRWEDNLDFTRNSARDCLIANKLKCTVCARGALFLSTVKFKNALTVAEANENNQFSIIAEDGWNNTKGTDFMAEAFDVRTQEFIEAAYERSTGIRRIISPAEAMAAVRYGRSFKLRKSQRKLRLIKLMQNIIRNEGEFIIPAKYYKPQKRKK